MRKQKIRITGLFSLLLILFLISSCNIHTYYQSEYQEQYSKIITYKCAVHNAAISSMENLCKQDDECASFSFSDTGVIYLKLYLFTCSENEEGTETRSEYRNVEDFYLKFTSNNPVNYSIRGETSSTSGVYQTDQMKGTAQSLTQTFDFRKNSKPQRIKSIFIRFECPKGTELKVDYASVNL